MVKEEGVITEATPQTAWVKTVRSRACETCAESDSCEIVRNKKAMHVEVKNTLGVNKGDHVVIGFQSGSLLYLTFLLYLFPVISLVLGALAGSAAASLLNTDENLTALFSGFLLFAAAFSAVKRLNTKAARNDQYRPFLVKIYPKRQ